MILTIWLFIDTVVTFLDKVATFDKSKLAKLLILMEMTQCLRAALF